MQFRLVIPVWLLLIPFILPQQFNRTDEFHQKTINDGLADNTVYAIWQDELGFMWFGSEGGLNQYDGYSFFVHRADPDYADRLQNNNIGDIICYENKLWLATWGGGLNVYDRKQGAFYHYKNSKSDPGSLGHDRVQSLFVDKSGTLWVGTAGGGLNRYNKLSNNFTRYQHNPDDASSVSDNRIWGITQDAQGNIWVATRRGVNRFLPSLGKFEHFIFDPKDTQFSGANFARTIYTDYKGTIWVGTERGIYFKSTGRSSFQRYDLVPDVNNLAINRLLVTRDDVLLIGTASEGLFYYDQRNQILKHYIAEPGSESKLGSNDIRNIFKDSFGNYWIGTRDGGLSITRFQPPKLKLLTQDFQTKSSLPDNHIRTLFPTLDALYVGTGNNGLARLSPSTNFIEHIYGRRSLDDPERRVLAQTMNSKGELLFATRAGLRALNPINNHISTLIISNVSVASAPDYIQYMLTDKEDNLYIASRSHPLTIKYAATGKWLEFPSDPQGERGPIGEDIRHMMWGRDSLLWLATNNGLTSFDPKTFTFKTVGVQEKYNNIISGLTIWMLLETKDGKIWMTTESGLYSYHPSSDSFESVTENNGLSDNILNSVIEDNDGRLWLSTNTGISVYTPVTKKVKNFFKKDGFQVNDYIPRSVAKTADGDLYFGGLFGLLRITPSEIFKIGTPVPLHITKVTSRSESGQDMQFSLNAPGDTSVRIVTVPPNQRDITISFVALNYFNQSSAEYQFQLEGFDKNWKNSFERREAQYTNLDPGEYIFKVRAFTSPNQVDSSYVSLTIVIEPPFYSTWWFRIILFILFGLLITAVIKLRVASLQKNKINLEFLVQSKTETLRVREEQLLLANRTKDKLFSIIGHDLRSPFTALMGYTEILGEEYNDLSDSDRKGFISRIHASLHGLLSLIDNLLTWSRLNQSRITPDLQVIQLHQLISSVIVSQSLAAERKNISINLLCDEQIAAYADHNLTDAVIRNLLSNATKFTPQGGSITITCLQESDQYVRIEVADTGLGLSPERVDEILQTENFVSTNGTEEEKGTGLGLNLCKRFVRIMHGKFLLSSEPGKGSVFSILLPSSESTPSES